MMTVRQGTLSPRAAHLARFGPARAIAQLLAWVVMAVLTLAGPLAADTVPLLPPAPAAARLTSDVC